MDLEPQKTIEYMQKKKSWEESFPVFIKKLCPGLVRWLKG